MQVINMPTMLGLIKHVGIKRLRPLYLWGPSGIGKSEGVHQSCAEHNGVMCDIRVSQYESIDFRGIPDIQQRTTVWNMPATLPFKGNAKFEPPFVDADAPIYLFLDEINQGDPSVMSVCYQLINDRRVGEFELLDNVVIIAAGNREQDRGVTNRFPAPLANRGTHAELAPDVKSWSAWAAKAGIPMALIGFLNFRSELLHTFDPDKPVKAFATPRTWSFVAEDMLDTDMPTEVRLASMSGSVGEGPAVELGAFLDLMDKITPIEEIIANPTKVPVSDQLDLQWAMATHVAGSMNKDNVDQLHKFLERLEPEMVVMAWVMAIGRDDSITDSNAFLHQYAPRYRSMFAS